MLLTHSDLYPRPSGRGSIEAWSDRDWQDSRPDSIHVHQDVAPLKHWADKETTTNCGAIHVHQDVAPLKHVN